MPLLPAACGALPRRPGLPPTGSIALPRCAGLLGLHRSLCFFPPSLKGSQCHAVGLPRQGLALRCAPAGVAPAAGALATVRAATPGTHEVRGAHQQDGHCGLAASEGRRASVRADLGSRHCACRGTGGARSCLTRRGRGLADIVGAACPPTPRRSLRSVVGRTVFDWPGCVRLGTRGGRVLLGPNPTSLLPGAISLAETGRKTFWCKTIGNSLSLLGSRAPGRASLMASGLFKCERDHLITLSFICFYVLLPPVTRVLGLPQVSGCKFCQLP